MGFYKKLLLVITISKANITTKYTETTRFCSKKNDSSVIYIRTKPSGYIDLWSKLDLVNNNAEPFTHLSTSNLLSI